MSARSIHYTVSAPRPERHLLRVEAVFRAGPGEPSLEEPLVVSMPVWTPGSYLVREYARHVEGLSARSPEGPAGVLKLRKNAWAIAHGGAREVTVTYDVYAHDLSVRTNHVDGTHLYFNGAATLVRAASVSSEGEGWGGAPCELTVVPPDPSWHVATALQELSPGRFLAPDYDALVDAPVDAGEHVVLPFEAAGRPHAIVVWGHTARLDAARLTRDVARVVESEAALFGGAPFERYVFLLHLAPGPRGGLEHRASSTLHASPDAFDAEDAWHDLLALFAHEYFHLWQIKRTRPAGVTPFDYERENHTRLLWLFEGGTSYYDWLTLRRAELVSPAAYLRHLASELARLEDCPGRSVQSLEEASFDAWIKLYRPDEHTPNSAVSYYVKGEVVCALLDLELRARSGGLRSLDDVMRHLWERYGRVSLPVPEACLEAVFAAATGVDLSDVLHAWARTTAPLPYERVLAHAGLALRWRPGRGATLGLRVRVEGGRLVVATVLRGGAGERGGVAPGDELIALAGRRVDEPTHRARLRALRPGEPVPLVVARRDELRALTVTPSPALPEGADLVALAEATPDARALAEAWLGPSARSLWAR